MNKSVKKEQIFTIFAPEFKFKQMSFLAEYHIEGLVVGLLTFLIIGIYHPLVIKAEYYFGTKSWWVFLLFGIVGFAASILVTDTTLSILAGVFSFTSFWGIKEIFEQRKRVLRGWFPMNPKRKADYISSHDKA